MEQKGEDPPGTRMTRTLFRQRETWGGIWRNWSQMAEPVTMLHSEFKKTEVKSKAPHICLETGAAQAVRREVGNCRFNFRELKKEAQDRVAPRGQDETRWPNSARKMRHKTGGKLHKVSYYFKNTNTLTSVLNMRGTHALNDKLTIYRIWFKSNSTLYTNSNQEID